MIYSPRITAGNSDSRTVPISSNKKALNFPSSSINHLTSFHTHMKNRFSNPSNATTFPALPPSQMAHQLPRADPLEYEVTSWYGVERVERILLNTCIKRVSVRSILSAIEVR